MKNNTRYYFSLKNIKDFINPNKLSYRDDTSSAQAQHD